MDHEEDILGSHIGGGVIKQKLEREHAQANYAGPPILDGFSAWEVADEYGRSKTLIGYYMSESDAKAIADRRGYYGGNGHVQPEKLLRLEQRLGWPAPVYYAIKGDGPVRIGIDLVREKRDFAAEAKRKAMATLTPDERKTLGLDF